MFTTNEQKTKNEKPVFLLPLPFDEVLAALLRGRPQPKKEKQPRKKYASKQK
jgi:hypothetical protein